MSNLHTPSNPRHAQIFEILHQGAQAAQTAGRLKVRSVQPLDAAIAQKIMENAVNSLRAPQDLKTARRR